MKHVSVFLLSCAAALTFSAPSGAFAGTLDAAPSPKLYAVPALATHDGKPITNLLASPTISHRYLDFAGRAPKSCRTRCRKAAYNRAVQHMVSSVRNKVRAAVIGVLALHPDGVVPDNVFNHLLNTAAKHAAAQFERLHHNSQHTSLVSVMYLHYKPVVCDISVPESEYNRVLADALYFVAEGATYNSHSLRTLQAMRDNIVVR